jgi:hypothetical protein
MRPFRTVLLWQVIAIAVLSLSAAIPEGWSLVGLGGSVNVAAGWAYGWMVSRRKASTAGEALRTPSGGR